MNAAQTVLAVDDHPAMLKLKETAGTRCKHHWLIESPTGRASRGECKHCGTERVFINSTLESVSDGKK